MCLKKVQAYLYRGRSFNKYLTTCVCGWGIGVLYLKAMDYLVGFIFGYFIKETVVFLNRLSEWDWDNRRGYEFDLEPLTEDDLP